MSLAGQSRQAVLKCDRDVIIIAGTGMGDRKRDCHSSVIVYKCFVPGYGALAILKCPNLELA